MSDIDDSKMPLLDHLIELRSRLLWSFLALAIAFGISLYFARPIFGFLVQPLLAPQQLAQRQPPQLALRQLGNRGVYS